jgi:hypothetical protein
MSEGVPFPNEMIALAINVGPYCGFASGLIV